MGWIIVFGIPKAAFSSCDDALKKMQKAKADLDAAQAAVNRAEQDVKAANQNLAAAVNNLNAVAGGLGAQGKATGENANFGRSSTNPAFFDDPKYKAAKEAWQTARDNLKGAQNKLGSAKNGLAKAQDDYDAAKADYEKCLERERRERAKRLKDDELLLPPGELKRDKKLDEKVRDILKFSVRLGGGFGFLSGGDYNEAVRGTNAYRQKESVGSQGTLDTFGFGGGAYLEGIYWFKPNMGIGLGTGYYGSKINANAISDDFGYGRVDNTITSSLGVVPVMANFHYGLRLCEDSCLDLFGGPGLYFGCFDFNKHYRYGPLDETFDYKSRTTALGFQAGVGVDYHLSNRISLFGQMTGYVTSLSGLKDDWSLRRTSIFGSFESSGTGRKFWVFDAVVNGTAYRTWDFSNSMPTGTDVRNAKEGSVGGSSFEFLFGASIRF